uniref:Uncharacterized protein n=1 Tax=Rhodosorus marinus TaxID=101924 RepID=A0A7S3E7S9_9RHOD|mmetsp:Transcript_12395/g.50788  ORF Transcript_12395/g.50788 Transcript_12395/m.50788 type:complete len:245 (+) Transcript_12395:445-1179(+)
MRFCSLGDLGGQGSSEISMACIVRKSSESSMVPVRNGKSFLLDYKVMNSPGDYSGFEQSMGNAYTRELVKHICVVCMFKLPTRKHSPPIRVPLRTMHFVLQDSVYVETASSLYFKITTCLCHVVKLSWKAILRGQGIKAFANSQYIDYSSGLESSFLKDLTLEQSTQVLESCYVSVLPDFKKGKELPRCTSGELPVAAKCLGSRSCRLYSWPWKNSGVCIAFRKYTQERARSVSILERRPQRPP